MVLIVGSTSQATGIPEQPFLHFSHKLHCGIKLPARVPGQLFLHFNHKLHCGIKLPGYQGTRAARSPLQSQATPFTVRSNSQATRVPGQHVLHFNHKLHHSLCDQTPRLPGYQGSTFSTSITSYTIHCEIKLPSYRANRAALSPVQSQATPFTVGSNPQATGVPGQLFLPFNHKLDHSLWDQTLRLPGYQGSSFSRSITSYTIHCYRGTRAARSPVQSQARPFTVGSNSQATGVPGQLFLPFNHKPHHSLWDQSPNHSRNSQLKTGITISQALGWPAFNFKPLSQPEPWRLRQVRTADSSKKTSTLADENWALLLSPDLV
ncbi:hypothetical protein PoB_002488800 [Plakobranchus ocellatus]|uniref:Uncharacterized protein n=1 Tax=Plakobranchus ocellatus TaxID=259542 RepID=A0AAV3ZVD4_9GAST|nr:hypothetical protein PoB_002488800 [Plakobranchus ocellatus]